MSTRWYHLIREWNSYLFASSNIMLTPRNQLLHDIRTRVHVHVRNLFHFVLGQKVVPFIVMIEKVAFAVRPTHSNITGHVRRIHMTNNLKCQFLWKLSHCQSCNILSAPRATS